MFNLSSKQLADIEGTAEDLKNKHLILKTAIDTQVILQLLVAKGIVTREEVDKYRDIVTNSPKFKAAYEYLIQCLSELEQIQKDPSSALKELFNRKLNGNDK